MCERRSVSKMIESMCFGVRRVCVCVCVCETVPCERVLCLRVGEREKSEFKREHRGYRVNMSESDKKWDRKGKTEDMREDG